MAAAASHDMLIGLLLARTARR